MSPIDTKSPVACPDCEGSHELLPEHIPCPIKYPEEHLRALNMRGEPSVTYVNGLDMTSSRSYPQRTSRWHKLLGAVKNWWRNSPPHARICLADARKLLEEYDEIYGLRVGTPDPKIRNAAADIVFREGHRRPPKLENEVRILALTLERIVRELEEQKNDRPDS